MRGVLPYAVQVIEALSCDLRSHMIDRRREVPRPIAHKACLDGFKAGLAATTALVNEKIGDVSKNGLRLQLTLNMHQRREPCMSIYSEASIPVTSTARKLLVYISSSEMGADKSHIGPRKSRSGDTDAYLASGEPPLGDSVLQTFTVRSQPQFLPTLPSLLTPSVLVSRPFLPRLNVLTVVLC